MRHTCPKYISFRVSINVTISISLSMDKAFGRSTSRFVDVFLCKPIYSVSQKSTPTPPLKLFAIFSLWLSIFPLNFVKLLPVYIHTYLTNFGQFTLTFNKTALIFLGVLIVFTVSASQSGWECLDFIAIDEWPQFTQPQYTGFSGLWATLEFYHKYNKYQKQCPSSKMNFSWFGLPYRRKPLTTL